jgi:hypothetical protein
MIPKSESPLSPEPGVVVDFYRQTTTGPTCRPPTAAHVFAGYGPMGEPVWQPLEGDEPTGRVQSGKDLRKAQLSDYGKNSRDFSILGQVVSGPWPLPAAYVKLTGTPGLSFTVQVIQGRRNGDGFELYVNEVVGGLLPIEWFDLLQEPEWRPIADVLSQLRESASQVEAEAVAWKRQKNHKAMQKALQRIPGILKAFVGELELCR